MCVCVCMCVCVRACLLYTVISFSKDFMEPSL